jgi:hypothetical protein
LDTYADIYGYIIKQFGGECDNEIILEGDSEEEIYSKEFSTIKKQIGDILAARLTEAGLHNKVNTIMSIFLLKANHNKIESTKIDLSNSDGSFKIPTMTDKEVKTFAAQARAEL